MSDLFALGVGVLGLVFIIMGLVGNYGLIFQALKITPPGLEFQSGGGLKQPAYLVGR